MNYSIIRRTLGFLLLFEAIFFLLPLITAVIYWETAFFAFLISIAVCVLVGGVLIWKKPKDSSIYTKEAFVIVALGWIVMSLFGALPFCLSGEIPSYVDALFETVSGFTTTGATIMNSGAEVEALPKSILMWRSFTHWIGGMGVLVFILAITSKTTDRSMHILRAEMPGPIVDKFVPKARTTTLILYIIYTAMTLLLIILLLCGGMPLFDSVLHAFGTAGTGGFGMKADGLASYSPYIQWVITVFMFLFGINFNLYFLILVGKLRPVFKSTELWVYTLIFVCATAIIAVDIYDLCYNLEHTIRTAAFQVSSIITTTGFATTDFNTWPTLSKSVLLFLMFTGACAGSTAGGFKISRFIILIKKIGNNLKKVIHPRTATVVKFEGKRLDEDTLNGVSSYFDIYVIIFIIVFLLLSLDTGVISITAIETNLASALSCLNNIGPGLAMTGPTGSYAGYSYFSKIVLSLTMLIGRLEIYPILLTLNIATWIKR